MEERFWPFFRANARWLLAGVFLTFCSSFGQTFFISLSADQIRLEHGLSHGGFGGIYMIATLASAASLPFVGRIVDVLSVSRTLLVVVPALAGACLLMAYGHHIALLFLALYLLRLFGQGMMTHTAITAMGRWYVAKRGRAVSIATLGHQLGEASLPLGFAALILWLDWRLVWVLAAVFLLALALPLGYGAMSTERVPRAKKGEILPIGEGWTRAEVLRDPLFYIVLCGVLAPAFIGTSIFFHQVYMIELKGWSREGFALSFVVMAGATMICGLLAGILVDRFSATQLLPFFLIPLALACMVMALANPLWMAFLAMGLVGVSYGFSSTIFGAYWPEVYGIGHLGSIRSITVAAMVFSSALGPGLTGGLIDLGISFPTQLWAMALYCLGACALLFVAARRVMERQQSAVIPA